MLASGASNKLICLIYQMNLESGIFFEDYQSPCQYQARNNFGQAIHQK